MYSARVHAGYLKKLVTATLCMAFAAIQPQAKSADETLAGVLARLATETEQAYSASPMSVLSRDYFARFTRDPDAKPGPNEIEIDSGWQLSIPANPSSLTTTMKGYFEEFLGQRMKIEVQAGSIPADKLSKDQARLIVWHERGGGIPEVAESFSIEIEPRRVTIQGHDPQGLRDGIVRLVDMMGIRQGPILPVGKQAYKPRLAVRLGARPYLGSYRDTVFMGYNAACINGESLYALSTSDAIEELKDRRRPEKLAELAMKVEEAGRHGLKTYCWVDTRQKFPKHHPVFKTHPEIRGTLTWKADGEYVLCTEHPLVKRYLSESIQGLFKSMPRLNGMMIIIGGEGFYHCYMRSFGVAKGKSACPRCNALGAEQTVANLCNTLAEAARKINPTAEIVAWPYSAEHVWTADRDQVGLIHLLGPGTGLLTEVEKDEFVDKPEGFKKSLWDYSIDLIGPGERAKRQIATGKAAKVPIHIKSESELAFEAPRLPFIPCLDRWLARANAMAACGAAGAWAFPIFKPCYGSSAAEVWKYAWWEPMPPQEQVLEQLADRIAGRRAGKHLRQAWKDVSDAIPFSPELPSYYTGPYYLGPGQPMCADVTAKLPELFYGQYLFMGEATDAEGLLLRPTFNISPTGNVPVYGKMYRQMEERLRNATTQVNQAELLVPERLRAIFAAETSPIRWFYHTARTEANFYESCQLRDRLTALARQPSSSSEERAEAAKLYERWREVLEDEKHNTEQALPIMQSDMRLDYYYGGDHSFSHGVDVLRAKLKIIESEINEFLPRLARQCGVNLATSLE